MRWVSNYCLRAISFLSCYESFIIIATVGVNVMTATHRHRYKSNSSITAAQTTNEVELKYVSRPHPLLSVQRLLSTFSVCIILL